MLRLAGRRWAGWTSDGFMASGLIHSRKAVGEFGYPRQSIPDRDDSIQKNITILPSVRIGVLNQEGMFSCRIVFINVKNSQEDILVPKPRERRKTLGQ